MSGRALQTSRRGWSWKSRSDFQWSGVSGVELRKREAARRRLSARPPAPAPAGPATCDLPQPKPRARRPNLILSPPTTIRHLSNHGLISWHPRTKQSSLRFYDLVGPWHGRYWLKRRNKNLSIVPFRTVNAIQVTLDKSYSPSQFKNITFTIFKHWDLWFVV